MATTLFVARDSLALEYATPADVRTGLPLRTLGLAAYAVSVFAKRSRSTLVTIRSFMVHSIV